MKNTQKIYLAIFVIIGLAAFTFGIFYIGQNKNLFSNTITLSSTFKSVGGLIMGNNVRYAGIKIGTVSNIAIINDTSIKVEVIVEADMQKFIRKDSRMAIGSEGLMGDKLIDITSGTINSPNVEHHDILGSVKPIDIDLIMKSAQHTLHNIEELSGQLSRIAYKVDHSDGIIHTLLDDKEASNRLKGTLKNMESATFKLSENLEAAKHSILFRGYFKKKDKGKNKDKEEEEEEEEDNKKHKKEDKKDIEKK